MNKWKEKPLSRILAGLLALLLAIGTLPASPFRANADPEPDPNQNTTTSAMFKLVFDDPGNPGTELDADVDGTVAFSRVVGEGQETIPAEISGGVFTVSDFTSGETYSYSISLDSKYLLNGTDYYTFTAPADGSVTLEDGKTDGKLMCETEPVASVERFGYVTTQVGDTSEYLAGVAISINESSLVSSIQAQNTGDDGKYSFKIPEALIGQEVSITAQKNYFVTETVTRTIPDTASGEDPQQEIEAIAMNPVTATFNVGEKGYICIGEDTTPQTGEITIHPTGPVSFTVAPNDANYYQIDSVSATPDMLSEAGGAYSFDARDKDVTITITFIKKDATAPELVSCSGDDNTYFTTIGNYGKCWGGSGAVASKFMVSDPTGKDDTTGDDEYVSGPKTLHYISAWVNDGDYSAFSTGQSIDVTGATECDVPIVFQGEETEKTYSLYLEDGAGNKSPVYRFTYSKETNVNEPAISSAWLSPSTGHVIDYTHANAYTSDAIIVLSVSANDSESGIASVVLYTRKPGDATYAICDDHRFKKDSETGNYYVQLDFGEITELAVQATDNVGNQSALKEIKEFNLPKNAVLITSKEEISVSATVNSETYDSAKSYYFNSKPEFTFTLKDPSDGGELKDISVVIHSDNDYSFNYDVDPGVPNTLEIVFVDAEKDCFKEGTNTITISGKNHLGLESSKTFTFVLDTTRPKVTGFSVMGDSGTTLYSVANDGTFVTGKIFVEVLAEEVSPADGVTVSGLSRITLYVNNTEYETVDYGDKFSISPQELEEKGLPLTNIQLSAIAVDAAENPSVESKLYQNGYTDPDTGDLLGNSNIYTNTFSFDLDNPAITVSNPLTLNTSTDATARYTGEGADKKTWYKEIIHWSIQVSDGTAGVAKVTINGTEMTGTALSNGAIGFDIESSSIARDCSCKLSVTVTDKVGHSKDYETTIYIDMFDPLIKEFRIEAAGGLIVSDASGNYTNGPVKVYVKAEDPDVPQNTIAIDPNSIPIGQGSNVQQSMPTSGLAKVVLYLNDDQSTVQFGEATTQTNGYYVFTIPAEVAENFYKTYTVSAEAYDNSGLKSAVTALTSGENGNSSLASEKIIIENKKPGAVITLSDTGKKTIAGNTWYGADTEVKIQATDAESGLATIAVTVNGTAITADDSATPQAIGTFASKEKASPVYVIKTANHIASDDKYTIRVTAKDVSGNVYETEETFFIDRTAPVISGFTVTTEKAGDTLSNLAFGTFANGRVRVTITVKDDGSSAGLDSVALTINDGTPVVSKLSNGVAEFILPEEVVEGFYGAYALKATAVDVYGHTSEVKTYERQIQIDTVKPTVSVSAAGPNPMTKDGKTWYSSDVTWTIRLRDANAGIASATVKVNGTVIATDANGKSISEILAPTDAGSVKDVTFAVISSQAASADGSYTITVETTDYIGNKSEVYSGTVYVDKTAPAITSFAFLRDGEAVSPLTASDFGYVYFFEKDATVVISANDAANGYGLKSITYYMEDFNGVKTAEQTATPDASGNVTITVKAPFRGKIYAKATDGVNNESGYAVSKGFAAETKANHDGTASVSIERNETELRQPNGVDLYSGNVEIKINIADEIAGIKTVEWSVSAPYDQAKNQTGSASVGIDGTITGDGWTATAKDGNLVTGLTRTITVTHDSNDITVRVRMTDWAGNTTERQTVFGIDKVAPTVEYSFDNNTADPANPTIFDDERTLTITVTERNFVPGEFGLTIHNAYGSVPTISQWTEERDTQDPNKSTYTATVTFVYDGSYTLTLGYADRAGNRAAIEQVPAFVIDRSKPLVLVTYDNKKPVQDIYFDNFRTATVTVTERNFDVSRVTFTGNAPRTGTWTANGDEHTLTIYYDEDGDYSFGISVVDKAGNVSVPYDEERFIIDTTVPELELTGLLAANRGEVAPVITYTDANYMEDGVSFLLQRQNGDIINKPYTIEEIVEDGEAKGYRIVFKNFDPMKENDDIYTIQISAVDQAGNRTQQIMRRFSVNRFGSTYIMDGVEKMNGSNTNNPTDLVVLEVNVDEINADDVEIFVIRNSSPTKLVSGRDYDWEKVKMTEDGWEEYRYVIKSSSFAEDGEYTIRIISVDKAGNVNENDENGKNATISFCVDRVAPNIVVVSPVDETSYKEDTHRAVIEVRDNYLLGDVKIYLNDAEVSYSKSNYQYSFEIPQSDTKQTIRIVATDAAGNVSEVIVKDFLVSTNVFVRFLNTTWAIVAFIAILLCIGGAAVFILARRRRR